MTEHARVLFFATLRDVAGVKETNIDFQAGATISDVKNIVLRKYPALKRHLETMIVAMNHEFAPDDLVVNNGAEIAFFPPVSGGEGGHKVSPTYVEITEHPIDVTGILKKITLPTTGGVATFTGIVRRVTNRDQSHETDYLEYEAYRDMAEAKILQICDEIRSRWKEIEGVAIVQRVGILMPGEISVVIACAASHRNLGIFEATHFAIDRLKEIVPVWKKEVGSNGEIWVEGEYLPQKGD
jgi:MoaE-MoaD fusion protein